MAVVDDPLRAYSEAPTLEEAERALDELAAGDARLPSPIGDLYDELAEIAAEDDDYALAARVQGKAIQAGCTHLDLAREMLGWYLLKLGHIDAGEAAFDEARKHAPGDSSVLVMLASARADAGLHDAAAEAYDEAVALALEQNSPDAVDRARIERRAYREEQGLPADADDRLAPAPRTGRFTRERIAWSVAWFPPDQRDTALKRWPDLAGDLARPGYDRRIEGQIRSMARTLGEHPTVAPIDIAGLEAFATQNGLDPASGEARSRYAAERGHLGEVVPWPPGRNDHCWCRSGRKYKRCCGAD